MPIYEYECQACGHKEDFIQKFSDTPLTTCPQCGKDALHKNVSAPSFQLTGTGWYATDYKDKKTALATESSKSEEKSDKSTTDATTKAEAVAPKKTDNKGE